MPVPIMLEEKEEKMTNKQKAELRQLTEEGLSFKEIKEIVDCADSTIREYIKTFRPRRKSK